MNDSQSITKQVELLRAEISKLNTEANAKEVEIQNLILSIMMSFYRMRIMVNLDTL